MNIKNRKSISLSSTNHISCISQIRQN